MLRNYFQFYNLYVTNWRLIWPRKRAIDSQLIRGEFLENDGTSADIKFYSLFQSTRSGICVIHVYAHTCVCLGTPE